MIRPLKPNRVNWVVAWYDFAEPAAMGGGKYLPTGLFVVAGDPPILLDREMVRELDQRRAERLVNRLANEKGTPDTLYLYPADEWEEEGWENLAADLNCELVWIDAESERRPPGVAKAEKLLDTLIDEMARELRQAAHGADARARQSVAADLADSADALRSHRKKRVQLEHAVSLDAACLPALVALGEFELHRGDPSKGLDYFEEVMRLIEKGGGASQVSWGAGRDHPGRHYLRALYGRMMTSWHQARLADAVDDARRLLELNPSDNHGVRFYIPLLLELIEDHEEALAYYHWYEKRYSSDYQEPSFLFGWAYSLGHAEREQEAAAKYRLGMAANLFIAPMLLDLPEPPTNIWYANDRAEPEYADEFLDSYGSLWERDAAASRFLREIYTEYRPTLDRILAVRMRMSEIQDQRYDPDHDRLWDELVREERQLLGRD